MSSNKSIPKVFVFRLDTGIGLVTAFACAEDGSRLMHVVLSVYERVYLRQAMTGVLARSKYSAHYPDGYALVDLLDCSSEQLDNNPELSAALDRGIAANEQEQ